MENAGTGYSVTREKFKLHRVNSRDQLLSLPLELASYNLPECTPLAVDKGSRLALHRVGLPCLCVRILFVNLYLLPICLKL